MGEALWLFNEAQAVLSSAKPALIEWVLGPLGYDEKIDVRYSFRSKLGNLSLSLGLEQFFCWQFAILCEPRQGVKLWMSKKRSQNGSNCNDGGGEGQPVDLQFDCPVTDI